LHEQGVFVAEAYTLVSMLRVQHLYATQAMSTCSEQCTHQRESSTLSESITMAAPLNIMTSTHSA